MKEHHLVTHLISGTVRYSIYIYYSGQINIKCQRDGSMFPIAGMHRLRGIVDNPISKFTSFFQPALVIDTYTTYSVEKGRKMWSSPIFSSISIVRISREYIFDLIHARHDYSAA